jgi:hypothetical protein
MGDLLARALSETLKITALVFVMMTLVDAVNVWTRGKLSSILQGASQWRQYFVSSLIGVAPGCMGAFTNVSLYVHGMISFGALAGAMAAASGDEAFVMLALFPRTAIILFALLFVISVLTGWITDVVVKKYNIPTCQDCEEQQFHPTHEGFGHFVRDHVWNHIVKRHLWRTALWTFGALLAVNAGLQHWDLGGLTSHYTLLLLLAGALVGLVPESGPHLVFVTMYANGLVPFSVLFTSAFVQDGHGMLPMLSYSIRDSIMIKAFNIAFALVIGISLYAMGF